MSDQSDPKSGDKKSKWKSPFTRTETDATPLPKTHATPLPKTHATPLPKTHPTPLPKTHATPLPKTQSYQAHQGVKNVHVVKVDTINNGFISFGNKYVTTYRTEDCRDFGARSSSARERPRPVLSEELKSCTLTLSVKNKYHIADNIGNNWKRLARMLPEANFTDGQLENLNRMSENPAELVVNILNRWYEVAPDTATVGNLAKTLETIYLNDVALGLETK